MRASDVLHAVDTFTSHKTGITPMDGTTYAPGIFDETAEVGRAGEDPR